MSMFARMLVSNKCLCELGKSKEHSFCYSCYKSLPRDLRRALYRKIGKGYEKAFLKAAEYLLRAGQIKPSTPEFYLFVGILTGSVEKHRKEAVITCDETCWCWDADKFLTEFSGLIMIE